MIVTTPDTPRDYPHAAIGATLRARRIGAGLTLRRCAMHLGISMTHLSRIERGEVEMTNTERAAFDAATRVKA